ncbi:hypothetical protein [Nocardioides sp.]|uniref:hypothetical protein n=1 Tax=Nocardioides sp. TaxID=35761 RepID=UPI0035678A49
MSGILAPAEQGSHTVVRLAQQGIARLGAGGEQRRTNTVVAWQHLSGLYAAAVGGSASPAPGAPA